MRRVIAIVLLIPLLVIVLTLATVTFVPQQVLGWVSGSIDGVDVSADTLDVGWWPNSLQADGLDVQVSGAADSPGQAWVVGRLDLEASLWDWMSGRPFWQVAAADVVQQEVVQQAAPESSSDAPTVASSGDVQVASEPMQMPALSTLLSFRQILIERLKLSDGTQADVRLDHEGASLTIDLQVTQPSQTLSVQATGEAQERLLIDSDTVELALNFDWQSASLGASGHLINQLELQPEQVLQLDFAPSRIDFTRGEETVRGFALDGGTIAWRFADDQLSIRNLAGSYTLAGVEQPSDMTLNMLVEQLSRSPTIDVQYAFAETLLQLQGQLQQPANSFSGRVEANSAGLPSWLVTLPYHDDQIYPLEVTTDVVAAADAVSLSNLSVISPRNQGKGELAVRLPSEGQSDLRVQGKFHASKLLIPLVDAPIDPEAVEQQVVADNDEDQPTTPPPAEETEVAVENPSAAQEVPLFNADPLDWNWLDVADLDLQLSADEFDLQDAQFENLQLNVVVKDGTARIEPLKVVIGEGGLDATAELVKQADGGVAADLRYELTGLSLDMFGVFPEDEVEGGRLSSNLQLSARGLSSLDLVNTLNGSAEVVLYDMTMKNNMVDLVGSDLILEMLSRLNPFKESAPATELQCAFLAFDIEDGVIRSRDNLVVETLKMRIEGKAEIDLAAEDLDLTFNPQPKGGFGVGLTNVVKFVKLGGKLRSPGIEVDALGLVNSGAAVGAALSTGGLSLLAEGLVNRALGDSGCAQEAVTIEVPAEAPTNE
ncbi:MAG: AsmA family protein [Pseudomonadaceae bacterium]|nr:AsmA family protein [Pseudomonadaceae bacterium]